MPRAKSKPKGKPRGRPSKLTPEIQEQIVKAIKAGNYIETAAAYAGIAKDTLYNWLKEGARSESGALREFSDAVENALAFGEMRDLQRIDQAATAGQWQAAAWRLERRFPKKWGRQERHEISGEGGGALKVVVEYINASDDTEH
jgi:hypothetical protein